MLAAFGTQILKAPLRLPPALACSKQSPHSPCLQGKEVVFLETAMKLQDPHTHCLVEAIPLDADSFVRTPLYFKAEVNSVAGEWSQHHAKRMIDTREKVSSPVSWPGRLQTLKLCSVLVCLSRACHFSCLASVPHSAEAGAVHVQGLQGSIPANFPYLHVEFGLAAGFVHILDDESAFDPAFGRKVLAGLLQSAVEDQRKLRARQGHTAQQAEADRFLADYSGFDWTKALS